MKIKSLMMLIIFLGFEVACSTSPSNDETRTSPVKSWATPDGKHIFLSDSNKNQGYYFNNDSDRLCFTFSLSGMWKPTKEAGLLMSMDGKEYAGALLRSEEDLKEYKGKDLLARAVTLHVENFEKIHKQPPDSYKVEDFESLFSDSIKWTAESKFKRHGKSYVLKMVRYMTEVKPGWVAVVTASHGTNGDDTARDILESLRVTSVPDCYWTEISKLRHEK